MSIDLVVAGGTVVTADGDPRRLDLLVDGGRVAGFVADSAAIGADRRIDASGMHVLPGAIDPHVHLGVDQDFADDVFTETGAAAAGGVTTIFDMYAEKGSYRQPVGDRIDAVGANAVIDVGFHFDIMTRIHLEEMESYVGDLGQKSFKFRTHHRGVEQLKWDSDFPIDDAFLYRVMEKAAAAGPDVVVLVHCQNVEIAPNPYLLEELDLSGESGEGLQLLKDVLTGESEAMDVNKSLFLGRATGASVYIVHASARETLREIRLVVESMENACIEACLGHLTFTTDDPAGALAKTNPPVGNVDDGEAVWAAITDGVIDTIGTDHVAMRVARKRGDGDILSAALGFPVLPLYFPLILTGAYFDRDLPLRRIVDLTSANAARILGLYPRKGCLQVGSDADFVLLDLDAERPVRHESLPGWSDFSPYEGRLLRGWPVLTAVRGVPVWEHGRVVAARGHGEFVGGGR